MSNSTMNASEINYVVVDSFTLVLYSLTFLIGFVGNTFVLRVLFRQRKQTEHRSMSITNIYLVNLAFSDLLSATSIPFQYLFCSYYLLEHFLIGPYICVFLKSIQVLAYTVSILTMVVIAIDRYRLIYKPLQSYNKRLNPKYSLLIVWLLSILFALTCLISMRVPVYFRSSDNLVSCRLLFPNVLPISSALFSQIRATFLAVAFYLIPLLIIIPLHVLSIRTIYKRPVLRQFNHLQHVDSKHRSISLLIVILLVFSLCWLPIHIMNMLDFYSSKGNSILSGPKMRSCDASIVYTFLYWLAITTCCYNVFIYSWFNKDFRNSFSKCCRHSEEQRPRKTSNASQTSTVFYLS